MKKFKVKDKNNNAAHDTQYLNRPVEAGAVVVVEAAT